LSLESESKQIEKDNNQFEKFVKQNMQKQIDTCEREIVRFQKEIEEITNESIPQQERELQEKKE
jgi:hypothetical protein